MKKLTIGIILFLIVGFIALLFINTETEAAGVEPPFNNSIVDCIANELTLYTLSTCPHCKTQKEYLGSELNKFTEIECISNQAACNEAGISNVPAWTDSNGVQYVGVKTWEELRLFSEC